MYSSRPCTVCIEWPAASGWLISVKRRNDLESGSDEPLHNHDLWLPIAYICSSALQRQNRGTNQGRISLSGSASGISQNILAFMSGNYSPGCVYYPSVKLLNDVAVKWVFLSAPKKNLSVWAFHSALPVQDLTWFLIEYQSGALFLAAWRSSENGPVRKVICKLSFQRRTNPFLWT